MIRNIKLKNFRRHEDLSVDFTAGLNVIRGPNEVGKTTITEALLYALYGSKALRNTLAETVTWGKREGELRVEAEVVVEGVTYTFSRSKAGAECNYLDKQVVGQTEVTAFAAGLLGADAATASLLMMASQSGLRGALDEGTSAVSALMGKLADFDLIDRVIENAHADLTLGSDTALKAKLVQAEADLQALKGQPDLDVAGVEELASQVQQACDRLAAESTRIDEVLEVDARRAEDAYQAAVRAHAAVETASRRVDETQGRVLRAQQSLEQAREASADRPTAERLAELEAAAKLEADHARVRTAYGQFQRLPPYPESFWDNDQESFDAEAQKLTARSAELTRQHSELRGQVSEWTRARITSGKCPTCGQSTVDDDHVAKHNGELDAKIAPANVKLSELAAQLQEVAADIAAMQQVDKVAKQRIKAASALPQDLIKVDPKHYPPVVTWAGEVPGDDVPSVQQSLLAQAQRQLNAAVAAQGQVAVYEGNIADLAAQLKELSSELEAAKASAPDIEPLKEARSQALTQLQTAKQSVANERAFISEQAPAVERMRAAAASRDLALAAASARIDEYNKDLADLAFNNGLVAKLKKLKPAITDHLWNTVLAAVSTFFSDLRGEQSVVTKDPKGFRVNGQSIESLSGSTIDVLALAIRVALTKTFIPHCSFMTLDEPAHGCDSARTSSVLAFLASAGFEQIVLASHDELSESVADNLVQLGE